MAPRELVKKPKGNAEPGKRPKGNTEPVIESTATAEHYGPRELFAVVDWEGNLKRGMHVVSSQRLDVGLYEREIPTTWRIIEVSSGQSASTLGIREVSETREAQ